MQTVVDRIPFSPTECQYATKPDDGSPDYKCKLRELKANPKCQQYEYYEGRCTELVAAHSVIAMIGELC